MNDERNVLENERTYYYKLDEIMREKRISLEKLTQKTGLNINTIRKIKNNTFINVEIVTLKILADALDCSIHDLIGEDYPNYYRKQIKDFEQKVYVEKYYKYLNNENIYFLQRSLSRIGIKAHILPGEYFKVVDIVSEIDESPIIVNIRLRFSFADRKILKVVNFDVFANKDIIHEDKVKEYIIDIIEDYAIKNNFESIFFRNISYQNVDVIENKLNDYDINFHSDSKIDRTILKNKDYFTFEVPEPLPKQETWIKNLDRSNFMTELKQIKFNDS